MFDILGSCDKAIAMGIKKEKGRHIWKIRFGFIIEAYYPFQMTDLGDQITKNK
jgi:hypothetical protein